MAHVTVLGAGLVAGPVVRHILETSEHTVTVAARSVDRARALVNGHPRGDVVALEIDDEKSLDALVSRSHVMVSMLPYVHHLTVAKRCLAHGRHLVTTSYVQPAMRALDAEAKERGVILLNELGLDPGIDHMSAMSIIHKVRAAGGRVTSFRSYCGGLPAPADNNNPFGYKFSWSPRGVVLAARNAARYLRDGQEVVIPGPELFANPEIVEVEGAGRFEGYPNRDSISYVKVYDLEGVQTMFRGTLRNLGHCYTWKAMGDMGLYDDAARSVEGGTFRDVMASLAGISSEGDVEGALAAKAKIPADSDPIKKLAWLGMFDRAKLPENPISPLDALVARMVEKLQYAPGERDMIALQHEFIAEYPDRKEFIRSALVDFGIPNGETAMSRTVALPAAIGVLRILDGTINTPGVIVPVSPAVCDPILDELAALGIRFREERKTL
ncbi:MAG: saccharopine dehydrogenase C-terminal domain-containing protein [Polyangiales bacterium]